MLPVLGALEIERLPDTLIASGILAGQVLDLPGLVERERREAYGWAALVLEPRVIRLAVRVGREHAEAVLAELIALVPAGFEERDVDGGVEYVLYGAEGELPALGDVRAAAGGALVDSRPRVARRLGRALAQLP